MGVKFTVSIGLIVLLLGAVDAFAFSSGGKSRGGSSQVAGTVGTSSTSSTSNQNSNTSTSLPEPSTLYAVGSALALLGGAGWYIRRRK